MTRDRGYEPSALPSFLQRPEDHPVAQHYAECTLKAQAFARTKCDETLSHFRPDINRIITRSNPGFDYLWQSKRDIWFKTKIKTALNKRPEIRPRQKGLVGPELDWSVVYSDVSRWIFCNRANAYRNNPVFRTNIEGPFGRIGSHPTFQGIELFPSGPEGSSAHECYHTAYMGLEQIRAWTAFAHLNNVHFSKSRGYHIPGLVTDRLELFKRSKAMDLLPKHKRSEAAKIRRAARRGLQTAYEQPIKQVLITRYRFGVNQIKREWIKTPSSNRPLFKDYLREFPNPRVLTLNLKGSRLPMTGFLHKTLVKLFSRKEIFYDNSWFPQVVQVSQPDKDLKFQLQFRPPPVKAKIRQLNAFFFPKGTVLKESLGDWDIPHSTIPEMNFSTWDYPGFKVREVRLHNGRRVGFTTEDIYPEG